MLVSRTYAVQVDPTGSPDYGPATWANNCRKVVVTENPLGVNDPIEQALFDVIAYPNPSNHVFTLEVKGNSTEKVEVAVYDILGRLLKRIDNSDGQSIQFGDELPTGTYLTVIRQGTNHKTVKLIKQ